MIHRIMRVNLTVNASLPANAALARTVPVSLLIRPTCGLPGDFTYTTDSASLLSMLRRQTELPAYVLDRLKGDLMSSTPARIHGVELSERVLTEIGYFVD